MDDPRVTWRLEIFAGWGMRLDPAWLPATSTEGWRRVFQGEDVAARVFASGGAGIGWRQLADAAGGLTSVLEQYRMQWRCAEEVAAGCPVAPDAHLAAMAVPASLRPPRRTHPRGRWRTCALQDGVPVTIAEYADVDIAEGAAVAHRTPAPDRAFWAEPVASGAGPAALGEPGWLPRVDTDLRLRAFACEDAVAALAAAAATGHTGPDVLGTPLLCTIGQAAHHMIREYRTLLRAVWTDMEACVHAAAHDHDAEALLDAIPDSGDLGPGGRWRHMELDTDRMWALGLHPGWQVASTSVAAYRCTDADGVRWAEPVARPRPRGEAMITP